MHVCDSCGHLLGKGEGRRPKGSVELTGHFFRIATSGERAGKKQIVRIDIAAEMCNECCERSLLGLVEVIAREASLLIQDERKLIERITTKPPEDGSWIMAEDHDDDDEVEEMPF